MLKVFLASSLKNTDEAKWITQQLQDEGILYRCCVTDEGHLKGVGLFRDNASEIASADVFIAIGKNMGVDTAVELGMAYTMGKVCIIVQFEDTQITPSDTMAYYSASKIVNRERLIHSLRELKQQPSQSEIVPFHICDVKDHFTELVPRVRQIIKTGQLVDGEYTRQLEQVLYERFQKQVIMTSSGTSGLSVALRAIVPGYKSEVIVPSLTFPATIQAIFNSGNIPVFADVDRETWTLSVDDASRRITPKTGAIMPVHLFGCPSNIDGLHDLSITTGIPIVFDACQAMGSKYRDREIGSHSSTEVFSLDATKIVTGGLGGFISAEDGFVDSLRMAKNVGCNPDRIPITRGESARVLEFTSALALSSLVGIDSEMERRSSLAALYLKTLSPIEYIRIQRIPSLAKSNYQMFGIVVDLPDIQAAKRVHQALTKDGIISRFFVPKLMHKDSEFIGNSDYTLPITEYLAPRLLCLPVHRHVTDQHVALVNGALRNVI